MDLCKWQKGVRKDFVTQGVASDEAVGNFLEIQILHPTSDLLI